MIKKIIKILLVLCIAGIAGIGFNFYQTEHSKAVITTIKEDKINFFYRDDCKDCKKIFKQVYLYNLINHDVQFINLNQEKNRKYIDEYNIHTVPTFIHENEAYAGTQKEKIKEILK
ncbi:thioredoxin domain-containing protein [Lactococcus lactis]|uniref:thioredoxin domain-containing protein n=1 Tax=Lactococcus lactis TaxID=1358 RepID=UPI000200CECB|nr:thioredoxin domain-containing protein [Lactococcus lactis]ADZ65003.1 Thioredoxin [Lactococcus lactis subsp. lactis CV56]